MYKPRLLELEITTNCDLGCSFCYLGDERNRGDMPLFEALRLLDQARDSGVERIVFTGGEPLQYSYLEDLVRKANSLGWQPGLLTNGLRISQDQVSRFREAISFLQLSLHALPSESEQARVVCEQALRLQGLGIPVTVLVTLSAQNIAELDRFAALLNGLNVHWGVQRMCPMPGVADNGFSPSMADYTRSLKKIWQWMQASEILSCEDPLLNIFMPKTYIDDVPSDVWSGCSAGRWVAVVSSTGWLMPCAKLRLSDRNVFDVGFATAWQTSDLMATLRVAPPGAACNGCRYYGVCRGCRAVAYSTTGEVWGKDPLCPIAHD
ncbi:radical SAM/SPASM domain-containing protein [Thermodesulfobacteriota bacterium]